MVFEGTKEMNDNVYAKLTILGRRGYIKMSMIDSNPLTLKMTKLIQISCLFFFLGYFLMFTFKFPLIS